MPLHALAAEMAVPVIVTPFANHDNNQHAADENLRIGNLWYGVEMLASLFSS